MDSPTLTEPLVGEDLATGRTDVIVRALGDDGLAAALEATAADYCDPGGDLVVLADVSLAVERHTAAICPELLFLDSVSITPEPAADELDAPTDDLVEWYTRSMVEGAEYFRTQRWLKEVPELRTRAREFLELPEVRAEVAQDERGSRSYAVWTAPGSGPVELVDICGAARGVAHRLMASVAERSGAAVLRGNVALSPLVERGWAVLARLRAAGWTPVEARWRFRWDGSALAATSAEGVSGAVALDWR